MSLQDTKYKVQLKESDADSLLRVIQRKAKCVGLAGSESGMEICNSINNWGKNTH